MSLLELTAAMAIFALIAVMGVQALSASVRVRDRLTAHHYDNWQEAEALALLRRDLESTAPLAFQTPDMLTQPAVLTAADRSGFALSLTGQPTLPGSTETGRVRVEWRFDAREGALYRRSWLTLNPRNTSARGPDRSVLDGLAGIQFRVLTDEGWQTDFGNPDVATALPLAMEVILERSDGGELRLLVAS
ncbi:GspJ family type II secretion system protein [Ferrimonas balearica]|nr:GspJ family type II secretion system protein [Ferrimonas balearica]